MMSAIVQRLTFALIALCAYGAVAGEPAISVSPDPRMMLEEPSIQVSGAVPGGKVIVEASLADDGQQVWTSRGVFYADSEGRVDPGTLASVDGTYTGVDASGSSGPCCPCPRRNWLRVGTWTLRLRRGRARPSWDGARW